MDVSLPGSDVALLRDWLWRARPTWQRHILHLICPRAKVCWLLVSRSFAIDPPFGRTLVLEEVPEGHLFALLFWRYIDS